MAITVPLKSRTQRVLFRRLSLEKLTPLEHLSGNGGWKWNIMVEVFQELYHGKQSQCVKMNECIDTK